MIASRKTNSKETEEEDVHNSDADEEKYVDEVDMPGIKVDSKQCITMINLQIREDTAKYLLNLRVRIQMLELRKSELFLINHFSCEICYVIYNHL